MRAFSQLLDDLVYTRSRNTKLRLIGDYLKETPDPDRGYGLAALTGTLDIPRGQAGARSARLAEERVDPVLLHMSRDYVGDMAETVSLLWPTPDGEPPEVDDGTIRISDAVERLRSASRPTRRATLAAMLDHLDASGRFALLKLATGALRVGISARLAKQALADAFGLEVEAVEEVWHGLQPPFAELFDWAEGRAAQPTARDVPVFRPFMLAHPLEETQGLARRLCRRMEMGRDPRPAGPCRRRDPALQPHRRRHFAAASPTSPRRFATRGVLDGELLVRGADQGGRRPRRRGGELQRAPAAARPQECQPEDAGPVSRLRPALRHPVRRRRGSARAAVDRAAGAARSASSAGSIPSGSTSRS